MLLPIEVRLALYRRDKASNQEDGEENATGDKGVYASRHDSSKRSPFPMNPFLDAPLCLKSKPPFLSFAVCMYIQKIDRLVPVSSLVSSSH